MYETVLRNFLGLYFQFVVLQSRWFKMCLPHSWSNLYIPETRASVVCNATLTSSIMCRLMSSARRNTRRDHAIWGTSLSWSHQDDVICGREFHSPDDHMPFQQARSREAEPTGGRNIYLLMQPRGLDLHATTRRDENTSRGSCKTSSKHRLASDRASSLSHHSSEAPNWPYKRSIRRAVPTVSTTGACRGAGCTVSALCAPSNNSLFAKILLHTYASHLCITPHRNHEGRQLGVEARQGRGLCKSRRIRSNSTPTVLPVASLPSWRASGFPPAQVSAPCNRLRFLSPPFRLLIV